jgi:FkbM family methyltransferase
MEEMTSLGRTRAFKSSWLLRVRPAILADVLKRIVGVKRQTAETDLGFTFWIDPVSHFGNELGTTGSYEPPLTALVQHILRPGDVFIDVGANEGYFTIVGSHSVGDGRVWTIEPQIRLAPVIRENLRLNGRTNVELVPVALSDTAGTTAIHLAPSTNTGASGMVVWQPFSRRESVPTTTFDRFASDRGVTEARLIKIDCEGAEAAIVRGAEQFFADRRAQFVSIDYHPQIAGPDAVRQIDASFRRWGYHLSKAGNGCWVYHLPGLERELSALGAAEPVPPI